MRHPRRAEQLSIIVSGGHGSIVANAAGPVRQIAIAGPANSVYDVAASHNGFGTAGKQGLTANSTINEEFTCITGSVIEILNANTDGTYPVCLFGDLG